jgi:hypothetical protein
MTILYCGIPRVPDEPDRPGLPLRDDGVALPEPAPLPGAEELPTLGLTSTPMDGRWREPSGTVSQFRLGLCI